MDIARVTLKYTDYPVEDRALTAAHRRGGLESALARAVERAADAVRYVERELALVTLRLHQSASTVEENLGAEPGQQIVHLNSRGELQADAPRFDALIAMRADRIEHLQMLVHLWQQLPANTSTHGEEPGGQYPTGSQDRPATATHRPEGAAGSRT